MVTADGQSRFWLADVTFTSGGGGGTTVVSASDFASGSANSFLTDAITELDAYLVSAPPLVVTPVPEPATVGLVGAAVLGAVAGVRRWRRP